MYSYQLVISLTQKKHKWVFCSDHINYVFSHLERQLYDTLMPNVLGSFRCAKLVLVLVEVGGEVDVVSVGPLTIVAKEETILKRRERGKEFWKVLFEKITT